MYTKHRLEKKHIRKVVAGTPLYDSSLVKTGEQESKRIEEKNLEVVCCPCYDRGCLLYAICILHRCIERPYSHQEGYKAKFWTFAKPSSLFSFILLHSSVK